MRLSSFNVVSLTLGFAFLYIPMLILVIYSFNESKLVTVWAGFSTKWYGELLQNEAFLKAAWVTIKVAVLSSTIATVLGTIAAYAALDLGCTPFEAFRLVTLPIIAPSVIAGWLLAFSLSLDDLVIASFTSGPSATTLPIKIFSAVRLGVSPEINALSTLMIAIVTIGVITASLITKRSVIKAKRDAQLAERAT